MPTLEPEPRTMNHEPRPPEPQTATIRPQRSTTMRTIALAVAACALAAVVAAGQASKPAPSALPDWSGVWQMGGPTVFDRASGQPQNGRPGEPGRREFPPYTNEYEAVYRKNIERIKAGTVPD